MDGFFRKLLFKLSWHHFFDWMPDEPYIKMKYWIKHNNKLNLRNPKTYNEKLEWLKLYDRNPMYTQMVDKVGAKDYVKERIGEEYLIPTLGVWNSFDEIDFSKLPKQFVLKCTHDSGGLVICRDKNKLDLENVKKKINRSLKSNYYLWGREYPYKNVKPRILAEKYMEDEAETQTLTDYKIFCFDGEPKIIMTVRGGHENEQDIVRRMYDENWNLYGVGLHGKKPVPMPEDKPTKLSEMLDIARKLSKGIKHLRVDLYEIQGKVYFGELTFYHMSGTEEFNPESYNELFGSFIHLENHS